MAVHPNSLKAIEPYKRKKGEPALNQPGRNGWAVLGEKFRDRLQQDVEDLQNVLIAVAKTGDVQALRPGTETNPGRAYNRTERKSWCAAQFR